MCVDVAVVPVCHACTRGVRFWPCVLCCAVAIRLLGGCCLDNVQLEGAGP